MQQEGWLNFVDLVKSDPESVLLLPDKLATLVLYIIVSNKMPEREPHLSFEDFQAIRKRCPVNRFCIIKCSLCGNYKGFATWNHADPEFSICKNYSACRNQDICKACVAKYDELCLTCRRINFTTTEDPYAKTCTNVCKTILNEF